LHPRFTYFWSLLTSEELKNLVIYLKTGKAYEEDKLTVVSGRTTKLVLDLSGKDILEKIGYPHRIVNKEYVVLEGDELKCLLLTLGYLGPVKEGKSILDNLAQLSGMKIRDKCGTFIGARMGRPEKAKMRKLSGSPQVLFPIGTEGGRLRSFQSAMEAGKVTAEFPTYRCEYCKKDTLFSVCEACGNKTTHLFHCDKCGILTEPECTHGKVKTFRRQEIDIKHHFKRALEKLGDRIYPDLIKGVRGTSNKDHIPEHIMKGILRAKHDVFVNKDGTVRFDMSELPITHFKPKEVHCPIETLRKLGYSLDIKGNPLMNEEQILEIKPQDVILPASPDALDEQSDKVLQRVAGFVDEMLVKMYGLKPYYRVRQREDLIGHLVIGLAPHISAGTVARIIGFTQTQGLFAHPLFHAAMRRDCDGDEACVILLLDALVNFSRQYLPDSRGAKTMDAPLVLTSKLNPAEVDDMAHGLDIVWDYPLELYESAMKNPWEIKIEQIKHTLGTDRQYEKMGFTHDIHDINVGVSCSAYKALPSMEEKLKGQMKLAEKIRAVNATDVAALVIEKHFLRDTKGNLRKFSTQGFRCVACNQKYRRPPLSGKCFCGGRIIFTVSHGSVIKYLAPSVSLANKYNVPTYVKQTLDLLQLRVDGVFGKEREKQEGLGKWFG